MVLRDTAPCGSSDLFIHASIVIIFRGPFPSSGCANATFFIKRCLTTDPLQTDNQVKSKCAVYFLLPVGNINFSHTV
jgi:hypothetical protein